MENKPDRRRFLKTSTVAAGMSIAANLVPTTSEAAEKGTLAVSGGKPVKTDKFPSWPLVEENDRQAWQKVLEDKAWCRLEGEQVNTFEKVYAEQSGTKHCTAVANGTSALLTSLNALGVGPGDEVLVPPYTFVATINVVLLQYALPIFVDSDRQTSQIDATKMAAAVTEKTTCMLPVHLGGNVADMDAILSLSTKKSIPVIEDACQAHFAEWRGKKVGSLGRGGCFSFQVTKNLSGGEGGAITTNDPEFNERCYAFQNNGRGRQGAGFSYPHGGANLRLTEFQGALLLSQLSRVADQSKIRDDNAKYLVQQIQEIPGIYPAKSYGGCSRNAWHIFMFRYDKEHFAGASRKQFLKALEAEGIPCSSGYGPLNKQKFLKETLNSKPFKAIFGEDRIKAYFKNNHCPENDKLCEEAVWFGQTMLLGKRSDMDQIASAIRKISKHSRELAKL